MLVRRKDIYRNTANIVCMIRIYKYINIYIYIYVCETFLCCLAVALFSLLWVYILVCEILAIKRNRFVDMHGFGPAFQSPAHSYLLYIYIYMHILIFLLVELIQ